MEIKNIISWSLWCLNVGGWTDAFEAVLVCPDSLLKAQSFSLDHSEAWKRCQSVPCTWGWWNSRFCKGVFHSKPLPDAQCIVWDAVYFPRVGRTRECWAQNAWSRPRRVTEGVTRWQCHHKRLRAGTIPAPGWGQHSWGGAAGVPGQPAQDTRAQWELSLPTVALDGL